MAEKDEAELSIGSAAINAYSRLSYTMWFALAEFVDNSTQSRQNYDRIIDEVLKKEGQPLTVDIVHNRTDRSMVIADNSIGMTKADLIAALRIANPTADSKGRSKYGMGLKTAACWIGSSWTIETCEWSTGEEWSATVNVDSVASGDSRIPLTMRKVSSDDHYTRIIIKGLRRVIQKRSEETIRTYLGSIYMFDLKGDKAGEPGLKLTYNGEEILPPEEMEWDTDPSGAVMRFELPVLTLNRKTVKGWIGVLRKGGRKYGGFSIYQNNRQIQGFPNAWKPKAIFGGVDDEGANNLVAQRLTGVLLLDGFTVSHTKDAVLYEEDEDEKIEQYLVLQTKAYAEYAKSRRKAESGHPWTKEKLRDITEGLRDEFGSSEMKDALANIVLPPEDVTEARVNKERDSLTAEDELSRYVISDNLTVIISVKQVSEYDPYVVFASGANFEEIFVIINALHPYYQTLEATDAIEECIHQYVYDAVAEYKTAMLLSKRNPDSIRAMKDSLLRARVLQIQNADCAVRDSATLALFGKSGVPDGT